MTAGDRADRDAMDPGSVLRRIRIASADPAAGERLAEALRGIDAVQALSIAGPWLTLRYRPGEDFGIDALAARARALQLPLALPRWRLAWWRYTEAVRLHNEGRDASWSALIRNIYISRYRHRRHGRRDDRRQHWQQYQRREPER